MSGLMEATAVANTVLNTAFNVLNVVKDDNYNVQCLFCLKNYTQYSLTGAGSYIGHGEMYVAPISSAPGSVIEFMPRKGNMTLYGSLGAVFFQWENQVLVLTWQIPLSGMGGSNELGVAVASPGFSSFPSCRERITQSGVSARQIMDTMSGSKNARDMEYKAKHLYDSYDTKVFADNTYVVWAETKDHVWRATMGTCRKTEGSIEFIPKNCQLLAKSLS